MHGVLRYLVICVVAIGVLSGVGLLIAWTLWIGGGLIAFFAAGGGSPAENYSQSRTVVGGRFTHSPPLPTSPFQYALLGLLCIGVGTLVFVFG